MEKGSVLMEAIIGLPILLLVSLGVAQFAHIWLCRTVVQYAAFCAARATLTAPADVIKDSKTGEETETHAHEIRWAREAAQVVCATVSFLNPDPTTYPDFSFPGISYSLNDEETATQGTGRVRDGNVLSVRLLPVPDEWHRGVEVTMGVPLLFPLAGQVIGKTMQLYVSPDDTGAYFSPGPATPGPDDPTEQLQNEPFPRIYLRERAYIVKPFKSTWSAD